MYEIVRTNKQVNDVLNWAAEGEDRGTHYPGMSFEQGITAMFNWLTGTSDQRPDED